MVVAGDCQDPAVGRGAGRIRVLQGIAAAVDSRPLAIPDREDAVVLRAGKEPDLLAAPDGGRAQLLVDRRLELDVIAVEKPPCAPQRLVEPAQGRAAVPGNEAAGVEPGRDIALTL